MSNSTNIDELLLAVSTILPTTQLDLVTNAIVNRENLNSWLSREHLIGLLEKLANNFSNMPKTTDAGSQVVGDTIAYLHYFNRYNDWWIIEKDSDIEVLQVRCVKKLGFMKPEVDNIPINHLCNMPFNKSVALMVELNIYWEPIKLRDIPVLTNMFST